MSSGDERICYLIAAGDLTVSEIPVKEGDLVIAVDGGLAYCGFLGLEPDLLIGDFDSLSEQEALAVSRLEQEVPDRVVRLKPEKDDTDTLAALKLGLEKGCRSFRIYGGTGGRLDHTIANIQSLLFLKKQNAVGYLCDGNSLIFVIMEEEVRFRKGTRGFLSLFALGDKAEGVTLKGLKYPLEDYTVKNDFPIGISNEFLEEEGTVEVKKGALLAIVTFEA